MEYQRAPHNKIQKKPLTPLQTLICFGIIGLSLIGTTVYFIKHRNAAQNPAAENTQLLESVGRLILLPDETPIIATINQAESLVKEQPFYVGSENGDKLIIFPKMQKAIIFSPKRNIIVNAGPFVINSDTQK